MRPPPVLPVLLLLLLLLAVAPRQCGGQAADDTVQLFARFVLDFNRSYANNVQEYARRLQYFTVRCHLAFRT
jgi:hypothetical protein